LGADLGAAGGAAPYVNTDILNALIALGYSDKEAMLAVKQVPAGSTVTEGIRQALKALSKG
jgi:Holliday junction DNA helicase RuvA